MKELKQALFKHFWVCLYHLINIKNIKESKQFFFKHRTLLFPNILNWYTYMCTTAERSIIGRMRVWLSSKKVKCLANRLTLHPFFFGAFIFTHFNLQQNIFAEIKKY